MEFTTSGPAEGFSSVLIAFSENAAGSAQIFGLAVLYSSTAVIAAAWSALQVGVGDADGDSDDGVTADDDTVGEAADGEVDSDEVQPDKSKHANKAAISAGVGAMACLPSFTLPRPKKLTIGTYKRPQVFGNASSG